MNNVGSRPICLILYSLNHFNPEFDVKLSGSSAGRIAKQIYDAALSTGTHDVVYADAFDSTTWPHEQPDVLITILDNLNLARRRLRPEKIFGIAVNYHPLDRVNLVYSAKREGVHWRNLVPSDGIYQEHSALKYLDRLLIVGNESTGDSYSKRLPNKPLKLTHYKSSLRHGPLERELLVQPRAINVLFLMSAIGFRKGADLAFEAATMISDSGNSQINFYFVGAPSNQYWADELERVANGRPDIFYCGWMDNKAEDFSTLLSKIDFAVFPAREEGLVGALLEAIDHGIPSLHSQFVGIDSSDSALTLDELSSKEVREKILGLAELRPEERVLLHKIQLETLNNQFGGQTSIEEIVNDWLKNLDKNTVNSNLLLHKVQRGIWDLVNFMKLLFCFPRLSLGRIRLNYLQFVLSNLHESNPHIYRLLRLIYHFLRKFAKS